MREFHAGGVKHTRELAPGLLKIGSFLALFLHGTAYAILNMQSVLSCETGRENNENTSATG